MKPIVLPDLRLRRLWIVLGLLLVLAIVLACLLPNKDLPKVGGSDKLQHFIAFGLVAFWFGSIVVRADLPWVGLASLALGGFIELLQGAMSMGRDAEWLDFVADAAGVALGLALVWTPLGRWARWFEAQVLKARQ